jgi:AcrR family transcriptional regulator
MPRGSGRREQAVVVARRLLETEGPEALTMRAVAARLGIWAASLYKHFRDKEALEAAIIASGMADQLEDQCGHEAAGRKGDARW